MKNFTNKFKQFTSRLSARWLIMALMMLVGTSSVWGWTVIYDNTDTQWDEVYLYVGKDDWSECNLKMTEYDNNLFVFKGSGWDDAKEVVFADKALGGSTTGSICTKLKNDNAINPKVTYSKNKDFSKIYKYKATGLTSSDASCSSEVRYYWPDSNSMVETTFSGNVIQLAGSFNDWGSSTDYCVSTNNSTCSFEKELAANNKYEFKIIIDGTWYSSGGSISVGGNKVTFYTDKGNSYFKAASDGIYTFNIDKDKKVWITYSTACNTPELSDFTYTLPDDDNTKAGNEVIWNGNTHAATVKWKDENSTAGITIYYTKTGGSKTQTAPSDVGTYTVTIETTAQGDFCATKSPITLGTFTITCPAVTVPTVVANPSEIIKCGIDFKQRAEITITKLDGLTYTCTLDGNAVTIQDDAVTNIEIAGEYTITATNGCGNSNGTSVTITLTDNTVAISEIFGEPTICAGTKEQVYSIDKITSDGISYSWTLTGEGLNKISSTDNTVSISADNNAATQTEGVLYATVTKNDCKTTSNPKTITLIPLPTITTVDPRSGEACSNTTIADLEKDLTITKSANTNTKWYFKAAEQDVTAMLQAGDYTIKAITETGGCISSQGIVYTVTNLAESPDAPFANNTSEDICASYTEFNLTELVGWDAEAPENENITISWYTKDGENYNHTDADQYTIAANTFYARTQNETGCYSDYVALVIPTPITPATLKLTTTPANGITTPWVAIEVTVDGSKGAYTVSYPNNLNTVKNIQITKEGDTYTYLIPRPSAWGTGDDPDQNSGKKQVDYTVRATLNDGSEKCPSMGEVIIHLQDEANDTCNH